MTRKETVVKRVARDAEAGVAIGIVVVDAFSVWRRLARFGNGNTASCCAHTEDNTREGDISRFARHTDLHLFGALRHDRNRTACTHTSTHAKSW